MERTIRSLLRRVRGQNNERDKSDCEGERRIQRKPEPYIPTPKPHITFLSDKLVKCAKYFKRVKPRICKPARAQNQLDANPERVCENEGDKDRNKTRRN